MVSSCLDKEVSSPHFPNVEWTPRNDTWTGDLPWLVHIWTRKCSRLTFLTWSCHQGIDTWTGGFLGEFIFEQGSVLASLRYPIVKAKEETPGPKISLSESYWSWPFLEQGTHSSRKQHRRTRTPASAQSSTVSSTEDSPFHSMLHLTHSCFPCFRALAAAAPFDPAHSREVLIFWRRAEGCLPSPTVTMSPSKGRPEHRCNMSSQIKGI